MLLKFDLDIHAQFQLEIKGNPDQVAFFEQKLSNRELEIGISLDSSKNSLNLKNSLLQGNLDEYALQKLLNSEVIRKYTLLKETANYLALRAEKGTNVGRTLVLVRPRSDGLVIALPEAVIKPLLLRLSTIDFDIVLSNSNCEPEDRETEEIIISKIYCIPSLREEFVQIVGYCQKDINIAQLFDFFESQKGWRFGTALLSYYPSSYFKEDQNLIDIPQTVPPKNFDLKSAIVAALENWALEEKEIVDEEELKAKISLVNSAIIEVEEDINFKNLTALKFKKREVLDEFLTEIIPLLEANLLAS